MTDATAKHTPGPWTFADGWLVQAGGPLILYYTNADDGLHGANADKRLIAAAPDLLAALQDALSGWRYIRAQHGDLSGVGWDRVEQSARAAIAKATGAA